MRTRHFAALLLLPIVGTACIRATISPAKELSKVGLVVTGVATVEAVPDMLVLSLGVAASKLLPQAALAAANKAAKALVRAVKAGGVKARDIQTQSLNISPQYKRNKIVRYEATESFRVRVRDLKKGGDILGSAVAAAGAAARVFNVSLTVADPEALKDEGRKRAVEDAKTRAATMAKSAGVRLGDPVSIEEISVGDFANLILGQSFETGSAAFSDVAALAPSIEAGTQEIEVRVRVRFALK